MNLEPLVRCHVLALAAMQRVADVAVAPARPGPGPAAPAPRAGTDAERLAVFTPKARARILAVLDRLPG